MANNKMTPQPICSFCGRTSDEVERLIAGPGVYICNECIEVCDSILKEEHLPDWARESLEQIRREDPAESAGMTTPSM